MKYASEHLRNSDFPWIWFNFFVFYSDFFEFPESLNYFLLFSQISLKFLKLWNSLKNSLRRSKFLRYCKKKGIFLESGSTELGPTVCPVLAACLILANNHRHRYRVLSIANGEYKMRYHPTLMVYCQLRARRALSLYQRCFVENQKGPIAIDFVQW